MSKMDMPTKRPQTPPPLSYVLTPPPTGGFSNHGDVTSTKKSIQVTKEGESPTAFFENLQEGLDVELTSRSDDDTTSSPGSSPGHDESSNSSTTTVSSTLSKHSPFISLALAIDAHKDIKASTLIDSPSTTESPNHSTQPFRFLDLPLSVRRTIYTHLVTIPALICVRQNHTSSSTEKLAYLYTSPRHLLPGIAYALPQLTVYGFKTRFSNFPTTNVSILRVNKEIYVEARAVLYGANSWEIVKPTSEMTPGPDFGVRLFPAGCQTLVRMLSVRICSFYGLDWLLGGGYNVVKNYYRGLKTLTLILELENADKGFGKKWARHEGELWRAYVLRLKGVMAQHLFGAQKKVAKKTVPVWMDLRVLFSGERYVDGDTPPGLYAGVDGKVGEHVKREELKAALVEAWELFKKGG